MFSAQEQPCSTIFRKNLLYTSVLAALLGLPLTSFGQSSEQDASSEDDLVLEEVIVTGIRRSLAEAVNVKRDSGNIVDVIMAQDIGKLPDENAADALSRITGVTVTRNSGEGSLVSVRGVDPGLTNVSINGQGQASTSGNGREFNFSLLSSQLISSMEVLKSPTAEMEEGGVGATINVRTRRALDFKDRKLVLTGYIDYSELASEVDPRGSVLWADRFADGRFGVLVNLSASQRTLREDSIAGWGWRTKNGQDFQTLNRIRFGSDETTRKRGGATVSLQFRPSDTSEIYFDTIYSELDDERLQIYQEPTLYPKYVTPTEDQLDENRTFVNGQYKNFKYASAVSNQPINETNWSTVLGGSKMLSEWTMSGEAAYMLANRDWQTLAARADSKKTFDADYALIGGLPYLTYYEKGGDVEIDPTDPSYYVGSKLRLRDQHIQIEDEKVLGQIDFERPLEAGWLNRVQMGAKYKTSTKTRNKQDTGNVVYTVEDLAEYGYTQIDDHLMDSDNPQAGHPLAWFDIDAIANDLTTADGAKPFIPVEDLDQFYDVQEDTTAAYVRFDYMGALGSVEVIGNFGIRYVQTDITSKGIRTINDVNTDVTQTNDYDDFLPSLNFAFSLREDLILRGALASVMARPRLSDLTARETVNVNLDGDISIRRGNVFLDPYRANQFDLVLEWYFKEGDLASIGYFYKDIESFIFTSRTVTDIGEDNTMTVVEPTNSIDGATVEGFEISYQSAFTNLPSPWDGFGVLLNYTYQDSDALFESEDSTVNLGMPGLSKHSYNAIIYYEKYDFGIRLAYNYRDDYLLEPSGRQNNVIYSTDYSQLDASLNYNFTDQLTLRFDVVNALEAEVYEYADFPNRINEYLVNGRRYHLGLSYDF